MATLWLVCGAGRGVGKTWIARGLCEILGEATYAKHGHGEPKPDKPGLLLHGLAEVERFLSGLGDTPNAVVESNTLVLEGRGDLVIFVEGEPSGLPRRDDADQLRRRADIAIAPDAPIGRWRRALSKVLDDREREERIVELCLHQVRRQPIPTLAARTKVWLQLPGDHGMGKGLVQLLEGVDHHSTLRAAAEASGMSYRHAWDLIRTAEAHLGLPLIVSQPGGRGGGGSSLSALGLRLVRSFRQIDLEVAGFAKRRLVELLADEPDA